MKTITSRDNSAFRKALRLRRRKFREETGRYLVEGIKPLEDGVKGGAIVEQLFLSDEERLEVAERLDLADETKVLVLDRPLFRELSDTEHSQGVIAVVRRQSLGRDAFVEVCRGKQILVLDRLQDPGNAGTMIRTAEAAGFAGILAGKGTTDLFAPKVVRSAAGSLFRMPILDGVQEEEILRILRDGGWKIAATSAEKGIDCFEADVGKPAALVIGNEGNGVGESLLAAAHIRLQIPMAGQIESLNAAVAAGILMYRINRSI